jgi:hypothetical protein
MEKRHRKSVPMHMSNELKNEWLPKFQRRYAQRHREGKSRMLDEFCEDYGYERKYAIKLLSDHLTAPTGRKRPGPERQYVAIEPVVRQLWLSAEQPCGKRLQPILRQWLPFYERRYGRLPSVHRRLIGQISPVSLDRLLAPARAEYPGRGRGGTKPGSLLKTEIPIRTSNWDITRPGYLEADTVAHCGGTLAGEFIWSLTYTDIFSGWTEGRAVWNKGSTGVVNATTDVEQSLPFTLLGFDCDNGSEFLNHHLWGYLAQRPSPVAFTRSRPYKKNDNAYVEQKNWTWPRQLLGYSRLEDATQVAVISAIYKEVWGPLQNFFLPCLKLKAKWREGSRWRKSYHPPRTAYQRLGDPGISPRQTLRQLRDLYETLDPLALKDDLEKRLRQVLRPITKDHTLGKSGL